MFNRRWEKPLCGTNAYRTEFVGEFDVLIAEPPQTPWDVHFSVLGFPVRIHPLFWLVGLLLGFNGGKDAGIHLLIWFVAFFSSILIHELGHALMIRRFGRSAHIVLYAMGGWRLKGGRAPVLGRRGRSIPTRGFSRDSGRQWSRY